MCFRKFKNENERGAEEAQHTCVCFESTSSGFADSPLLILMGVFNR